MYYRLAEYCPNDRVLLLEAGPRHESIVMSTMAMGWEGLHHTDWDWRYISQPMAKANNRQIHLPRGKFLGGSSGANGTLMLRGVKEDYNRLARMGIEGWSWDEVLPFFKKSETFHPTKEMKGDASVHGNDGPLHTSHHPLAPISERLVESFLETGLPWEEDMFSNGTNIGVGHVPRTVFEGVRTTG
jgi:choline dehydrogenase-like flavoprotein